MRRSDDPTSLLGAPHTQKNTPKRGEVILMRRRVIPKIFQRSGDHVTAWVTSRQQETADPPEPPRTGGQCSHWRAGTGTRTRAGHSGLNVRFNSARFGDVTCFSLNLKKAKCRKGGSRWFSTLTQSSSLCTKYLSKQNDPAINQITAWVM